MTTVQELINQLEKVADKTKSIGIEYDMHYIEGVDYEVYDASDIVIICEKNED